MALAKTRTEITASQSNAADATDRERLDVTTAYGGIVTMKITNGDPAPSAQCEGRVLISHTVTLPAAAAAGVDWKTVYRFGGGIVASAVTEQSYEFGPEVRHIQIEFTGNTVNAVTVEALATTFTV